MPADAEALLDRTLHALADAGRRSIVVRLSRGPASASERGTGRLLDALGRFPAAEPGR